MAFLVFDIETRVDKQLLNRAFFADAALSDEDAYRQWCERNGDFAPLAAHIPISIAVGQVGEDHVLGGVETLALNDYSEEKLVREFWKRAEDFTASFVTFNGRRFDFPVMELQALRL